MAEPTRLEVGRIGRAHGIKGDVTVVPITNRAERFAAGSVLFSGEETLTIVSSRPHQDRFVVHFEGVDDRNAAEALRNRLLSAAPIEGDEDELWVHELIGTTMRDRDGNALGTITSVESNPAHDQLVLDNGKLVPIVFVVSQADHVVTVDLPEGLLDL